VYGGKYSHNHFPCYFLDFVALMGVQGCEKATLKRYCLDNDNYFAECSRVCIYILFKTKNNKNLVDSKKALANARIICPHCGKEIDIETDIRLDH
jgi:thiaminase